MLAFREYFKANERWEMGVSDRAGIDARNALGTIRILARERRKELQQARKERKKRIKNERGEQK
jgi:hypothetical protein